MVTSLSVSNMFAMKIQYNYYDDPTQTIMYNFNITKTRPEGIIRE